MAGSTVTSPIKEMDVSVLKETLRSQQQLLQKLYAELDVEREAASTSTNEALSMILRLQGEKAAMKMEASQYKRLAEEKIGHAEESLEMFQELVYQKEMEISALEFQIEDYKYKLLSFGCQDLDDTDNNFSGNPFGETNDSSYGEKGIKTHITRLGSLPSVLPTDFYKMRSSSTTNTDLVHGMDSRKTSMEFNSYWEQIRMLDEKVKEISDCEEVSNNKLPTEPKLSPKLEKIKTCEEATPNSDNSTNTIHDVFDVHCVEEDNRLEKPDMFTIGSPGDEMNPDPDYKSPVECGKQEKRSWKPSDEALLLPSNMIESYRSELQQLAQRVEQLEGGGNNTRHGISEGREDELNLFMQLREQLNSIQSEIRTWRPQKPSPADELSLVPLIQVMLGFWL